MSSPLPSLNNPPPARSDVALRFDDVWIGFEEGPILRGLTFSARPEETLILLGETGTGKTLALKMAAGLLSPDRGQIEVLGNRVSSRASTNF